MTRWLRFVTVLALMLASLALVVWAFKHFTVVHGG